MHNDPNYYNSQNNFKKIKISKKIYAEITNILLIFIVTILTFNLIGKKIIKDSWGKDYVDNINVIFNEITIEDDLPTKINNEYGFLDLDEDLFIKEYIDKNDVSNELAFEKFLETRANTYSKIREDELFKEYNAKFNSIYFMTYGIFLFLPIFVFEFLIIIFNKKNKNLGMMIFKQSIVNSRNNEYPHKFKLLLRFFVIYLIEHLLLRLFFGNAYLIILLLAHLILVFPTKNRVIIHDIFSLTKVIEDEYVGYTE